MGVLDKIKNALFEVEYVEVEEPPKKEKKVKKEKREKTEEKPIAKKVVLPGTRSEKVKELQEEELKDEDFEMRPRVEPVKEKSHEDFKIMEDSDFKVDDDFPEQPEILRNIGEKPIFEEKSRVARRSAFEEGQQEYYQEEMKEDFYQEEVIDSTYSNNGRDSSINHQDSKLYGRDNSYNVPVHQYGTYEKKEEKVYFKPSPIISPIYGILDKNYKKEDVVSKKDIRITSNYSRSNVNVDDIRNKAFGRRRLDNSSDIEEDNTFEVDDTDDNLLVDLTDEKDKPEVKQVTVGDAMEYFQDLGLEYNVDYVDASKDKTTQKKNENSSENKDDKVKTAIKNDTKKTEKSSDKKEEKSSIVEVKDESKNKNTSDATDDDNLFDLIDSMYSEDN